MAVNKVSKKSLLDRLRDGVVVGDGGFVIALEKRGYVKAGPWTPECVVEHPEAVLQLHREFVRAGADVAQAFSFYASEDKLYNRGNLAGSNHTVDKINKEAAALAIKAASEVEGELAPLTVGGISQCPSYLNGDGKEKVKDEFKKQLRQFKNLDFLLCEYFEHIEEMEWAIQACKEVVAEEVKEGLPKKAICASMCIGPEGDLHDVSAGDCAVRMAKAGANVVGVNCHFDPFASLETMQIMKDALEDANLLNKGSPKVGKGKHAAPSHVNRKVYLMCQPLAFHTPDAGRQGFIDLPEFPFALEPRICTRWDMHKYARDAYKMGIRYIGGCCGFEPYHIRAVSEELEKERGKVSEASDKHDKWGAGLRMHTKPWVRARANKNYWKGLEPASGRPYAPALSEPDEWEMTQGHDMLAQHKEATTEAEMKKVLRFAHERDGEDE
jgi:betaine-homocysteine S-methyltransferase